jgi:microcompartment protein PduB
MDDQMISKIMEQVMGKLGDDAANATNNVVSVGGTAKNACGMTEFVGTALGDTIGMVIANVDPALLKAYGMDGKLKSIGIISARTGAGPHIFAADEAVKATNTEILKIETCRDTKGGCGHGSLIVFGAEDVSDARRAVEGSLSELNERVFGDIWTNSCGGHMELQYTARASYSCNKAWGAPLGKAFGIIVGAPAGIGIVSADTALKAATVDVVGWATPTQGTSFTNECILFITGESGAVRQSVIAGREAGLALLGTLGSKPVSLTGQPYI